MYSFMSLYTWLSSFYVVVYMVVVVLCRCIHGCRRFMSLYTWLSSFYVVVHMVVVVLCRCIHGCRRFMSLYTWLSHVYNDIKRRQPCIQRHKTTTTMYTRT
jgi:hypothetical protein